MKPFAARLLLAIAVCFLALQWVKTGMQAHAAGAGLVDSHVEADMAPDKGGCDAGHANCSAAQLCSCAALPAAPVMPGICASAGRLPEPRLLFADYLPGHSVPPPLVTSA